MNELLPCPFCKSTNLRTGAPEGLNRYWIASCFDCEAAGPTHRTKDGAIAAWNCYAVAPFEPSAAEIRNAAFENAAQLLTISRDAIRLIAGELTANEMRCVMSIMEQRARTIRELKTVAQKP